MNYGKYRSVYLLAREALFTKYKDDEESAKAVVAELDDMWDFLVDIEVARDKAYKTIDLLIDDIDSLERKLDGGDK